MGPRPRAALSARFAQTRFGVMKHLKAIERWLTPFQRDCTQGLEALAQHLEQGEIPKTMPDGYGLDIRLETRLRAPAGRVFVALTRDVGQWWRAPYRQAGPDSTLSLEAKIGAMRP